MTSLPISTSFIPTFQTHQTPTQPTNLLPPIIFVLPLGSRKMIPQKQHLSTLSGKKWRILWRHLKMELNPRPSNLNIFVHTHLIELSQWHLFLNTLKSQNLINSRGNEIQLHMSKNCTCMSKKYPIIMYYSIHAPLF